MVKIFELVIYVPLLSMAGLFLLLLLQQRNFYAFGLVWFEKLKNEVQTKINVTNYVYLEKLVVLP